MTRFRRWLWGEDDEPLPEVVMAPVDLLLLGTIGGPVAAFLIVCFAWLVKWTADLLQWLAGV